MIAPSQAPRAIREYLTGYPVYAARFKALAHPSTFLTTTSFDTGSVVAWDEYAVSTVHSRRVRMTSHCEAKRFFSTLFLVSRIVFWDKFARVVYIV